MTVEFPSLGSLSAADGFVFLEESDGGLFRTGCDGVRAIAATGDGKVEFVAFTDKTLALVRSSMGYPAVYPVRPVEVTPPLEAVLMDLDGTSVKSEKFWVWIIERTTAELLGDDTFSFAEDDLPFVSGHSVSEHLSYCISKYCPSATVEDARAIYFRLVHHHMAEIMEGRGRVDAFEPAPGLKEFLLTLKEKGIKIALVSSGLYEKAYPEIKAAFDGMGLGRPEDFYDAIVTAGFPIRKGEVGTLGELSPKPHPWLYAEAARVGLGIPPERAGRVIGIEDSGAGICAVRLAGFAPVGVAGGNIEESGTAGLCKYRCNDLFECIELVDRLL